MPRVKGAPPVDPRTKAQNELDVINRKVERLEKKYAKASQDAVESKAALDLAKATQAYLSQHPALHLDADTAEGVQDAYDGADDEDDTDDEPM